MDGSRSYAQPELGQIVLDGSRRLRALLDQGAAVDVPSVHDPLTALLAARAGFPAVFVGGGTIANTAFGVPDLGILGQDDFLASVSRMAAVLDVPIIADLDNGGDRPADVRRTVVAAERAGVSAIMLDDTRVTGDPAAPLRTLDDAIECVTAALTARDDALIIARTDALYTMGVEEAARRAKAMAGAGADVVFVVGPTDQCLAATAGMDRPSMLHCRDKPSSDERATLRDAGFRMLVYHPHVIAAAYRATRDALDLLRDASGTHVVPQGLDGHTDLLQDVFTPASGSAPSPTAVTHSGGSR